MKLSSDEQKIIFADLKNLILGRIEGLLFDCAELLYQNRAGRALRKLQITFNLLPPDVLKDCLEEEKALQVLQHKISVLEEKDPFDRLHRQERVARLYGQEMLRVIRKVQGLLYDRYLRTGYRGFDLTTANLEKGDWEAEADEDKVAPR